MRDLLSEFDALMGTGEPVGRAVVTSVWGSAPRAEGACMLATASGRMAGSVSGGCVESAVAQVDIWHESPGLTLLSERGGYWPVLRRSLTSTGLAGPRIHDARIAALCLAHRVRELWSVDRDFSRFPALVTRNPLA